MKASRRAADRKRLAASKQSAEERRRLAADLSALRRMREVYRRTSAGTQLRIAECALYMLQRELHRVKRAEKKRKREKEEPAGPGF